MSFVQRCPKYGLLKIKKYVNQVSVKAIKILDLDEQCYLIYFAADVEVAAPIPPDYQFPSPKLDFEMFSTVSPQASQSAHGYTRTIPFYVLIISSFCLLILVLKILIYISFNVVKIRKVSFSVS